MPQNKRTINLIVVHCSATPATADIGVKELTQWHRERGFRTIGYHWVIRRDGTVEAGRPEAETGAHVEGYNANSIGVCMVGGVAKDAKTVEENFTAAQFGALASTLYGLLHRYPEALVCGHRDLSPDKNRDGKITPNEWLKGCPSFDVRTWMRGIPDLANHTRPDPKPAP